MATSSTSSNNPGSNVLTSCVKGTVAEIQWLLRNRHGREREEVDDAIVQDFADLTARQSDLLATATWAASVTSGLLLIIGMVGITSLMLLIVRERSSEIGLRRALGAAPRDIAGQFFLEGIGLAAAGVLTGCTLGFALTMAVVRAWEVQVEPSLMLVAVSLGVSLGSGALACALPAIMAARVKPAIALHR
jgi:putative ABC transport system permease protein